MGLSLRDIRKRLNAVGAQVNPFDQGRTYNTTVQNRAPAPPPRPVPRPVRPAPTFGGMRSGPIRPVKVGGSPNANVGNFFGSGFIENTINSPNKIGEGFKDIAASRYKQGVGKATTGLIESPLGFIPIGRGAQASLKGASLAAKAISGARAGALYGGAFSGAYGAGSAAAQNANARDILKSGLVGGAVGAGGGALIGASPAAVVGATKGIGALDKALSTKIPATQKLNVGALGLSTKKPSPTPPKVKAKTPPTPVKPTVRPAGQGTIPTPDRGALVSKPFLSTTGLMTRHGPEGKALADLTNQNFQVGRDLSSEWFNRIPNVTKLRKGDADNFALAVQGLAKPANSKVSRAVKEWQALTPKIRQSALDSGLDVGKVENYFPRMVKKEYLKKGSNNYNSAVNHLVESGQVSTPGEAVAILDYARKSTMGGNIIGSFKFSRDFDLPPEMYDTSKAAVANYLEGAAQSVAGARTLGLTKEGRYSTADKLIGDIAARGGDAREVKKAFEQAMGIIPYSERASKASNVIRGVNVATKLGLGAITNSAQTVNTIVKNGYIDTLKGAGFLATKEGRQYARETGAFTNKLINDLRESTGVVTVGAKIGAPGFNAVEKFNRYLAATAGKFHAERVAGREGRTLSKKELLRAGRESSDLTQFIVAPHTLPGWASTPVGKLVAQFQTFSYKQTGFVANEILKPLAKGNALPLLRLLSLMPVGYGIYNLKDTLRLKDNEKDTTSDRIVKAWRSIGGGGTALDVGMNIKDAFEFSNSPSEFAFNATTRPLGPTVGTVAETLKAGYSASQGNTKPAAKLAARSIPIVGPSLANARYGSSGAGTFRNLETDQPQETTPPEIRAAAFKNAKVTVDGKEVEWNSLKESQKKELARADEMARNLYDQEQAMKTGLKTPSLHAPGLPEQYATTLDRFSRMTPSGKERTLERNSGAEYEFELAKYEDDRLNGKITDDAERIRRQNKLAKLKAGIDFKKPYRDLYSLNKDDVFDHVEQDPQGQETFEQVLAYGDALVKAGVIRKNKFRNKDGSLAGRTGSGGRGGRRSPGSAYKYAISLKAGGSVARPKISVRKPGPTPTKKVSKSKPKVTIKKSLV